MNDRICSFVVKNWIILMLYPKTSFTRMMTHFRNIIPDFTDNNLINIIRYGQDYYASSEVNYINQIDPDTLETVGRVRSSQTRVCLHVKTFFNE